MSFADLNYHIRPREGPIELHFLCTQPLCRRGFGKIAREEERERKHDKCKCTPEKERKKEEKRNSHVISSVLLLFSLRLHKTKPHV